MNIDTTKELACRLPLQLWLHFLQTRAVIFSLPDRDIA